MRELISKLQTMRKEAGFEVTDRIHVQCECGETLQGVLANGGETIKKAVLALSLNEQQPADGAYAKDWSINGEDAKLTVWKA